MNRLHNGQFAKKTPFIILVIIILMTAFVVVSYPMVMRLDTETYVKAEVATTTPVSDLEVLIEKKVDERMKDPNFIKEMRKEARFQVVNAINIKTTAEMYDYLQDLKAQVKK